MPCFKYSCSMAHAFMDRWSQEAREGGTCRYPERPWHGPGGCGLRLRCVCLPLTLSHSYSALSWGYASVPGPPSPPPQGSSFCHGPLGVTCPSILTLSSAPGPGAIRSARPRRWPQMSWIYRAPHAAPRPPFPDYLWLASPSSPSQWPSETEHDVKERAEWSQPQEVTRR